MEKQEHAIQPPEKLVDVDDYNTLLSECVEIQKEERVEQEEANKSAFDQVEQLEEVLAEQISAFALGCYAAEILAALAVFGIFIVVKAAGVQGIPAQQAADGLRERLGQRFGYYKAIEDFNKNLGAAALARHPEKINDALMGVNSAFDREGAASDTVNESSQFVSEKFRIRDGRVWYEIGDSLK